DYRPGQPEIDRWLPIHSADHADVHEVIGEMRAVVDAYPNRVLIGEIYLPLARLMAYYGRDLKGAHLPFNFQLLQRRGKPRRLPGSWKNTRRPCPMAPGPTGFSATTTGRALRRGLGPSRRRSPPFCC